MILGKLLVQAPTWIVDGIDSLPSVCYLCLLLIFSYRNNLHSCCPICSVPVLLAFFLINQSLPIPISWWIFPIFSRFLCGFSFFFFKKKLFLIHFEWIFEEIRDKNPIKFCVGLFTSTNCWKDHIFVLCLFAFFVKYYVCLAFWFSSWVLYHILVSSSVFYVYTRLYIWL